MTIDDTETIVEYDIVLTNTARKLEKIHILDIMNIKIVTNLNQSILFLLSTHN